MKLALGVIFVGAVAAILLQELRPADSTPAELAPDTSGDPAPASDPAPEVVAVADPVAANDPSPEPEPEQTTFEKVTDTVLDPVKTAAAAVKTALFGTKYDSLIANAADANGIDRNVLYKLLWVESHFREDIITGKKKSATGALGIAQFEPATAVEELGSVAAALDPNLAIPGAARYLAKLRAQFGGDITKAVAAYNWGAGHVSRLGLANAPAETRTYVAQILGVSIG